MINLTIEINRRNYGLDLVRFLAVSMVLVIHGIQELFHIAIPYFWIIPPLGVELFFSLSGFLIGRILIKKINQDSYSFFEIREFWVRRLLRILPLYLTLYFIYLVFYNLFLYPVKFDFSYLFFLQNLKTAPRFFGESWSLSIEEWFYLLVPLLIFCFYFIFSFLPKPWRGTSAFLITVLLLICSMPLIRFYFQFEEVNYQGVFFRMDAISYGLFSAYFSFKVSNMSNTQSMIFIFSGILIALLAAFIKMNPIIIGKIKLLYFPLIGIGTSFFVFGMFYFGFKRKIKTVTYISVISYSIYLIHLSGIYIPLSSFTIGLNVFLIAGIWLLSIPVILCISALSYKYIESPFLKIRR